MATLVNYTCKGFFKLTPGYSNRGKILSKQNQNKPKMNSIRKWNSLGSVTHLIKNASQVMCCAGNNYTEYLKMNKFCNVWNSDKHLMKLWTDSALNFTKNCWSTATRLILLTKRNQYYTTCSCLKDYNKLAPPFSALIFHQTSQSHL